jgi:hypothetical protein
MQSILTQYVLAFMLAVYPVKNHEYLGVSDSYTRARYEAIAADFADVALDPDEPALFADGRTPGRVKTAILLASIGRFESGGYREDVDTLVKLGDGGAARCLLQIHPWPGEVINDRASCLRAGLRHLRASFSACGSLAGYTVGHCVDHEKQAEKRMQLAEDWIRKHPWTSVPLSGNVSE